MGFTSDPPMGKKYKGSNALTATNTSQQQHFKKLTDRIKEK